MVSVNSSSNAWANWQTKNTAPAPTSSTSTTQSTEPSVSGSPVDSTTAPSTTEPAASLTSAASITSEVLTSLTYSAPSKTQLDRVASEARKSLSKTLERAGYFAPSAPGAAADPAPVRNTTKDGAPEILSQAEVVAQAAYSIVASAGAESSASKLVEQFG